MAHAYLSASGAHRWAYCAGSPKAEAAFPDEQSPFAAEGTAAHDLAEHCLKSKLDAEQCVGMVFNQHTVTQEMADYVQVYVDHCRELMNSKSLDFIEERVEFTHYVPEGFGTADFITYHGQVKTVHMIDLKYGKGVKVYAENNLQLALYGLGVMQELEFLGLDMVDTFNLSIDQPRLDHFDTWEVTREELINIGKWVAIRALAALEDDPDRTPSEKACTFCRARFTCRSKATHDLDLVARDYSDDFKEVTLKDINDLTTEDLANLYPHLASIEKWAKATKEYCLAQAMSGTRFDGLKLVSGRTTRSWVDDTQTGIALMKNGMDEMDMYESKMLSVAKIEKLLGKNNPITTDEALVKKSEGKPALVKAADKRKEWTPQDDEATKEAVDELFAVEDFE